MILVNNVFNSSSTEVMEDPALAEGSDNFRVCSALPLCSDDEAYLLIGVLAGAHHLDEPEWDLKRCVVDKEDLQRSRVG